MVLPKPNYPANAFAGTAPYYLRFRPPYPCALVEDLVSRAGISGNGRLLDLASGPGRVLFAISGRFREIRAVDLEPEMIEAGSAEAARLGIDTITWEVGRAEELAAPSDWFELVTIGDAFHRLDQQVVAERSLGWLQPGGYLAIMGNCSTAENWEPWQQIVARITRKWIGRDVSTGGVSTAYVPGTGAEHTRQIMSNAGFSQVESRRFEEPHEWTIDSIIGNLYSLSVCSRRVLPGSLEAFEAELRAALLAVDPGGSYHEDLCFEYTLGRRTRLLHQ